VICRQLLWHRHRMVQARTRIMNQLQAVALNEGLRCKKKLWRTKRPQLESFQLAPWANRRRSDLLELLDRLNPTIAELSQAVGQEVEDSSGNRRRLGHITEQGSSMLRFLLVEAAQVTVRSLPEWRSRYFHLMVRRGRKIAKVAMARRLAVCLYWMLRQGWNYQQWIEIGSHVEQPGHRRGVH
jgi:transposase